MYKRTAALALLAGVAPPLWAGVEKVATPDSGCSCIVLWVRPLVSPPKGWVLDEEASYSNRMLLLVPAQRSFSSSPVFMYANATPRKPASEPESLIQADIDLFKQETPGLQVSKATPLTTAEGRKLPTYRFVGGTEDDRSVATLAYEVEDDYLITFAVSAHSQDAHDAAYPAFKTFVGSCNRSDEVP